MPFIGQIRGTGHEYSAYRQADSRIEAERGPASTSSVNRTNIDDMAVSPWLFWENCADLSLEDFLERMAHLTDKLSAIHVNLLFSSAIAALATTLALEWARRKLSRPAY